MLKICAIIICWVMDQSLKCLMGLQPKSKLMKVNAQKVLCSGPPRPHLESYSLRFKTHDSNSRPKGSRSLNSRPSYSRPSYLGSTIQIQISDQLIQVKSYQFRFKWPSTFKYGLDAISTSIQNTNVQIS